MSFLLKNNMTTHINMDAFKRNKLQAACSSKKSGVQEVMKSIHRNRFCVNEGVSICWFNMSLVFLHRLVWLCIRQILRYWIKQKITLHLVDT